MRTGAVLDDCMDILVTLCPATVSWLALRITGLSYTRRRRRRQNLADITSRTLHFL